MTKMHSNRASSYKMKPSCRFAVVSGALVAALNVSGYFLEDFQIKTTEEVDGRQRTERYARSIVASVDWPHEYLLFSGVKLSAINYLRRNSAVAYNPNE